MNPSPQQPPQQVPNPLQQEEPSPEINQDQIQTTFNNP